MKHRGFVLVAEDEPQARRALCALLEDEGYRVVAVADGRQAADVLAREPLDAAILDIRMPEKDGLAVLEELRRQPSPPPVLIMTAYGSSDVAIQAMALGAFDYLTKPINFEELRIQLERAIESRRRAAELEVYRAEERAARANQMIGDSPAMQRLYKLIGQVAPTDSTVLITGESGTGKELIAEAIHRHSPRARNRLVKVNCAAIPETLLEAEMFGYERGAFTGAFERRIGKFEFAAGGTIFLDEIGDLTPSTQAKLLRVLQDRVIERLGSNVTIPVDVRVLAATHRDLAEDVRQGRFREDLYYRLSVVVLRAPPLRERREDIPALAQFLLRRTAARLKLAVPAVSPEALAWLAAQPWPGNVRELEHCLERALLLSRGGLLTTEHLEAGAPLGAADPFDAVSLEEGLHAAVERLERRLIERALARAGGNRSRAAELLKINRRLLYDKMRHYGLLGS
ncbi:MAG: sigma-54 dependent transcriptional regulator [Bryobacterales bacterium]|nr:sigma-54 dependent transcriptional regulator [Bryobacteraceae bacterium]MDW8130373.1 sigma-54 dependent transcriptional regulator [Bryobacterales bacterium]